MELRAVHAVGFDDCLGQGLHEGAELAVHPAVDEFFFRGEGGERHGQASNVGNSSDFTVSLAGWLIRFTSCSCMSLSEGMRLFQVSIEAARFGFDPAKWKVMR